MQCTSTVALLKVFIFPSLDVIIQIRSSLRKQIANGKFFKETLSVYLYTFQYNMRRKIKRKCLFIYIVTNIYLFKITLLPLKLPINQTSSQACLIQFEY